MTCARRQTGKEAREKLARPGSRVVQVARAYAFGTVLVLLGCVACTPPVKQFALKNQAMSCEEANRAVHETMKSMRFTITTFEPAAPGKVGLLRANRPGFEPTGGTQHVTVRIECTPAGVDIDASEDGKLLGQIDFKRAFYLTFGSVVASEQARRAMEERQVARTAPQSVQRGDLQVRLTLAGGTDAKLDFGFEMEAAGVLPVRVQILNLTFRNYSLDPDEIRLTRDDRERIDSLSPQAAARRIASARDPEGQPLTNLGEAEIAGRLEAKHFRTSYLSAGARAEGFLYFPAGSYVRAKVVVTDEESGEAEGFIIEF